MKRPTNLVKRGSIYYYRHKEQGRSKWLSLRTGSYDQAKTLLDEIKLKWMPENGPPVWEGRKQAKPIAQPQFA